MSLENPWVQAAAPLPVKPAERPLRLFGYALGWLTLGVACGVLAYIIAALIAVLYTRMTGIPIDISGLAMATLYGGIGMEAVMLVASWRRAKYVGDGDRATGLGWKPIRMVWLLLLLAVILVVYGFGWLVWDPKRVPNGGDFGQDFSAAGTAMRISMNVLAVVLAPLGEELFFRGWLTTGLLRYWAPHHVVLVTALSWAALHLGEMGVAVPNGLIFGAARYFCGSVRAPIALHMLNNLISTGLYWSLPGP
jgi:membrane protease YdiL (CAAX protease family)